MGEMTKKDITRLAFKYGYFPSYSGKLKQFFFRIGDQYGLTPTPEQTKHLALFGTIVNNIVL